MSGFEDLTHTLSLDPDDPEFEHQLAEAVSGTYSTGWNALRTSATSCLAHAAIQTQQLLRLLERLDERSAPPGETSLLLTLRWQTIVSGPALSAALLAAFSLESFLRLGFQIAVEPKRTRDQRRKGIDDVTNSRMIEFGGMSITNKLDALCRAVACRRILKSDPIRKGVDELVRFRNDCVHDTPLLTLRPGVHDRARREKERSYAVESNIGSYQRIALWPRPVHLKHALKAAQAHDDVVRYFDREMAESPWGRALHQSVHNVRRALTIAEELPTGCEWQKLRELSTTWESVGEPRADCDAWATRDLAADLTRRSRVKRVK